MDKDTTKRLLESKIRTIVTQVLREASEDGKKSKLGDDKVEGSKSYKRKYSEVEKALSSPTVNATQVMASALNFDADDDTERSHAFKKLHKDKAPSGGVYKFEPDELTAILANAPSAT